MPDGLQAFFYCIERGTILIAVHTDAQDAATDADNRADLTGESHTVIARTNTELVPALNRALAKNEAEWFASLPNLRRAAS